MFQKMWETALLKLVLTSLVLNYFRPISAKDSGLISKSKLNSPANANNNANGQSTREIQRVNGEKLVVAEDISCWEKNGHWEKVQVCPYSKIVTGHRLRYLSRTGLTGIELKCTEKYGRDVAETHDTLVVDFEDQVEKGMPRGTWGNWKNGSRSAFAEGFSFSRGELSLRRSVKNYNVIYHNRNQRKVNSDSDSDSDRVVRKCPPDHAICGLTAMMDKAQLGILTSVGLKCCHHCFPEEKWVAIHHVDNNNRNLRQEHKVNATVGLQRSLQNPSDFDEIPQDLVHDGFTAQFGKTNYNSTGFNWRDTQFTIWKRNTTITETYICEAQSSCVLKQLVGHCGSVRVPVGRFCKVSVPIGILIPEACTGETSQERIPKGSSGSIPYQLSLRFQADPPDGPWQHICSGVILDKYTAVTAAHCFNKTLIGDLQRYRVVAGENILHVPEANEQIQQVRNLTIHPAYTHFSKGNDIAILHVNEFVFNKHRRPLLLKRVPTQQLSHSLAVISGWSLVIDGAETGAGTSNSLRTGHVTILSPQDCLEELTNRMKVPVRQGIVCAKNRFTRTCNGDAGGPLVIRNYKDGDVTGTLLVGIISFGARDCSRQNTAVASSEISHFYDWIQANRDPRSSKLYTSCSAAMELVPSPRSQKQRIYPHENGKENETSLEVLCDFETDGGGWTIIQKRSSGPAEEFDQNWTEYEKGFGSLDGNFWLGLENIHALTKNGDQELRIELEDFEGKKRWAKYSRFSISDALGSYRLRIGEFSEASTAGDSMTRPEWVDGNRMPFTTKDRDNDGYDDRNCAGHLSAGGWWFRACSFALLNGLYRVEGEVFPAEQGIHWHTWTGFQESLAKTEMKIRKRK